MRAADFDLIFVPDPLGDSSDYWQTRWRAKLSTARAVVAAAGAPTAAEVTRAAAGAKLPILFIGHSVGAIAIAHAAGDLASADVRGAFLVAPLDGETYVALHGGGPIPRARLPWPSVLVASRTDPRASFEHSQALAADWGAEFVDAGDSGGIDADSGHGPWPDGLLRLAKFLKGL
jgi:predicted alpha/beta hydrolase family esterase